MRVNRIVINNKGPLKNIDVSLSQVTLVVGDNERGKTTFLNWIAKGLFENPEQHKQENWAVTIGGKENIQMDIDPFYHSYDGERMKNLLFIQEADLLFKYKNKEELIKFDYWNGEINNILYGRDNISESLQKSFIRAMGVGNNTTNSWLITLHERLFDLKNTLEDLLPEVEKVNSKVYGLYQLNNSIGTVSKVEQEFESKEELYFTLDKIQTAQKYFNLLEKDREITQQENDYYQEITQQEEIKKSLTEKDDTLLDLDVEIDQLTLELAKMKNSVDQVQEDPYIGYQESLGETVLGICIGLLMTITGVYLAFQSMGSVVFTITKTLALGCFIIGVFFLLKVFLKGLYIQQLSQSTPDKPNYVHQFMINKAKKNLTKKDEELENKQKNLSLLKEETAQLRKKLKATSLKIEILKKQQRGWDIQDQELDNIEQEVFRLYSTDDINIIQEKMKYLRHTVQSQNIQFDYEELQKIRYQKNELLDQRNSISEEYKYSKSHIIKTIRSLLEEFKSLENQKMIEHFYPGVYRFYIKQLDLENYYELLELVDSVIDQVSKDRYRSEKIVNIYNNIEINSHTLLSKTLESRFFEFLIQNVFGGKYQTFKTHYAPSQGIRIFAETGHGEVFPLETLSASAFAQFWFVLRLSLAKTILKNTPGIILLDDPFSTFDPLRKQNFIDVLNALAHEGWQIICTITNDDMIFSNFSSLFRSELTVVDLNKDNS